MKELAVILIRGRIGLNKEVKYTLDLLRLKKKHTLVIIKDNPTNKGMLQKIKDAVTWGPINEETKKLLIEKKGEQKHYHLNPPRGGFERKGIKTPYKLGGALGDRGEAINELIKKML